MQEQIYPSRGTPTSSIPCVNAVVSPRNTEDNTYTNVFQDTPFPLSSGTACIVYVH